MIDWAMIGDMWLGYVITILVLVILALFAWITGLIIQKTKVKKAKIPQVKKDS